LSETTHSFYSREQITYNKRTYLPSPISGKPIPNGLAATMHRTMHININSAINRSTNQSISWSVSCVYRYIRQSYS